MEQKRVYEVQTPYFEPMVFVPLESWGKGRRDGVIRFGDQLVPVELSDLDPSPPAPAPPAPPSTPPG